MQEEFPLTEFNIQVEKSVVVALAKLDSENLQISTTIPGIIVLTWSSSRLSISLLTHKTKHLFWFLVDFSQCGQSNSTGAIRGFGSVSSFIGYGRYQ